MTGLSPQFSVDQLYISQGALHPRLTGRAISSSRPYVPSPAPTLSDLVSRAATIKSVAGKPMRAGGKAAVKQGGLGMLRTAVLNNSGPEVGRRILSMGVHLANEIWEAEDALVRSIQDEMEGIEINEQAIMDVDKFAEHYTSDNRSGDDVEMEDAEAERVEDIQGTQPNEEPSAAAVGSGNIKGYNTDTIDTTTEEAKENNARHWSEMVSYEGTYSNPDAPL